MAELMTAANWLQTSFPVAKSQVRTVSLIKYFVYFCTEKSGDNSDHLQWLLGMEHLQQKGRGSDLFSFTKETTSRSLTQAASGPLAL